MPCYIFAGQPKHLTPDGGVLHAGGLQYLIEQVEELALLVHDPAVAYTKRGVKVGYDPNTEIVHPGTFRVSDRCLEDGITWDWFRPTHNFGNGVTIYRTVASPVFATVVHGTNLTLDEFVKRHGVVRLADLNLAYVHVRSESWEQYEARWLRGTCPQENHAVTLTYIVTTHRIPEFAYRRIQEIVEEEGQVKLEHRHLYMGRDSTEPGKHFSELRTFGKPYKLADYRWTETEARAALALERG